MHFKVFIWFLRTAACWLSVCFLTPCLTSVDTQLFFLSWDWVGMRGGTRRWRGDPGQRSQCSVSWEPADFRSAKSGHKALAAKPQRPTERFHGSIANQPPICRREASIGETSPVASFSAGAEDTRFPSAPWLRIGATRRICEISLHYFQGCRIIKIMHRKNTVIKWLLNRPWLSNTNRKTLLPYPASSVHWHINSVDHRDTSRGWKLNSVLSPGQTRWMSEITGLKVISNIFLLSPPGLIWVLHFYHLCITFIKKTYKSLWKCLKTNETVAPCSVLI